jgi:hypothetical protein
MFLIRVATIAEESKTNPTGRDLMNNQLKNALLSAALVMLAMPVVAQSTAMPDPAPKSEVGQRQENQQDRIAQGVKSGQLTAGETAHLEKNQARINKEVRNDRAANGGVDSARTPAGQPSAESPIAPDLPRQAQPPPAIEQRARCHFEGAGANATASRETCFFFCLRAIPGAFSISGNAQIPRPS